MSVQAAYTSAIKESLLKWKGCNYDIDISMHVTMDLSQWTVYY